MSIKVPLIIVGVALLACLVVLVLLSRQDQPVAESVLDTSQGPAFEVRVIVPRMARPLGGILPDSLVRKLDGTPSELRFDYTNLGAQIGSIEPNHLELKADGWDLFIETDYAGKIAAGTHLVFPLALGGRQVRLNCRPADPANGYLHTNTRAGSDKLDGRFVVELATCKNDDSGKAIEWPPSPLTVRGSFVGHSRR
jgi:hypothetical protein